MCQPSARRSRNATLTRPPGTTLSLSVINVATVRLVVTGALSNPRAGTLSRQASDISARDLVNKVWDEVAAERALRPAPAADLEDYDRLVEDAERHYVNTRYVLDRTPLDSDGRRPGRVKAKIRVRAARYTLVTITYDTGIR